MRGVAAAAALSLPAAAPEPVILRSQVFITLLTFIATGAIDNEDASIKNDF